MWAGTLEYIVMVSIPEALCQLGTSYLHFQKFKHFTHDFSNHNQTDCQRTEGRSKKGNKIKKFLEPAMFCHLAVLI